jgi:23S rRNA pseudouridine2604 synthase
LETSLNKYIADSGYCSRRQADKYIEQCRVTVNGNDAHSGYRVKAGDEIRVDGERIKAKKPADTVYIALNKPKGITCTTDLKDKTNIIDFVNFKSRIFPIGRLDKRSEGLIFLTNDGDIVNKILRAGNNHEKEYTVTVDKPITGDFLNQMRNGVKILGTVTKPCFVKMETENRFKIILIQGLNRQIRRMCEALDYNVTSLKRVRIMSISLAGLQPGKWRYFTPHEIETINQMLKNSSKTQGGDSGMDE